MAARDEPHWPTSHHDNVSSHQARQPSWAPGDSSAPTRQASVVNEEAEFPRPASPEDSSLSEIDLQPIKTQHTTDPEKGLQKITTAKDWSGPDDPGNAHNWPLWQKIYHTGTISCIALVGSFSSSVFTPGLDQVSTEFHVSQEVALVAYALFVLGLGVGAPFASPLSETLGRKYVYLINIPIFALFIIGTGFCQNVATLIITRFFAGFFGAPSLAIGSATIADIWPPAQRSTPMSFYVLTPFLGPALGPLIGGYVTVRKGWRWTSWTILFFTIAFLMPAVFMKETYKRKILSNRAKKLRLEGPPTIRNGRTWSQTAMTFVRSGLTRPLHMLFTEPVVTAFTLYTSFNFALVYAFFAAFPYVFQTYYAFSIETTGLTFIGLGVGCLVAIAVILLVDRLVYQPKVRAAQNPTKGATSRVPPEERLHLSMLGGPLISAGLFLFGWTAAARVHWLVPVVAEALFGCGNLLVFMSASLYVMDTYGPLYGASAMAANTLTRYVLGTAFPLFSVQMFRGMGVQWACTLLGCVSLVGCAVPFVLRGWGERARVRSGYRHGD